jgi:hypothetical protein
MTHTPPNPNSYLSLNPHSLLHPSRSSRPSPQPHSQLCLSRTLSPTCVCTHVRVQAAAVQGTVAAAACGLPHRRRPRVPHHCSFLPRASASPPVVEGCSPRRRSRRLLPRASASPLVGEGRAPRRGRLLLLLPASHAVAASSSPSATPSSPLHRARAGMTRFRALRVMSWAAAAAARHGSPTVPRRVMSKPCRA